MAGDFSLDTMAHRPSCMTICKLRKAVGGQFQAAARVHCRELFCLIDVFQILLVGIRYITFIERS